ncbi:hypothetical protein JCM3765_004772 [Sporobolomyces pararoseus]
MARFGLLDSEDEASDASSIEQEEELEPDESSTTRSISIPLSTEDEDQEEEEEEEEEDAPPRASLLSDQDEEEEEEEDQDDYSMDEQPVSLTRKRSVRATRQNTTTGSRTPSPVPNSRRKPSQLGGTTAVVQSPWAQQLKLEPKRVQVMQASFFGQSSSLERRELEQHEQQQRESKRRMIQQQPAAAAPSKPVQSQSVSVPTPVVDPTPFRPYRTYTRVPLKDSISDQTSSQQNLVDAGLALGRSYKIGWGTKGEILSLKGVYDKSQVKSDVVKLEKLKLVSDDDDDAKISAIRLLELQLAQSEIYPSCHTDPSASSPVPFASPLPSLRFHHFSSLFTDTTTNESDGDKLSNSPEAQLFKLASHLFDEIPDLHLVNPTTTTASKTTITNLRRRDLISNWLSKTLLPTISNSLNSPSTDPLTKIYLLLTTHQLSSACELSLNSNNLRLSTLISQIGTISSSSTDLKFQLDLELQLKKWKEFGIDSNVSLKVRRIYELLSGNLGLSKGGKGGIEDESKEFHVLENETEWKVAFAMGLWYSRNNNNNNKEDEEKEEEEEVARAMKLYEKSFKDFPEKVPSPLPIHYRSSSSSSSKGLDAMDPIYHLLKLYTSPTHTLEQTLSPSNFGKSLTDYRLPWHLYLLFSRVLRKRDFEDRLTIGRGEGNEDDEEMMMMMTEEETTTTRPRKEGNSVRADQVTTSYAHQLESLGLWEWSCFVLLHLELELPRAQSLQQLILRNVSNLNPTIESFLTETLKIPMFYLDRSKAIYYQSLGQVFNSYKFYLKALETEKAHEIVVQELGPEALIRGDENLVKRLMEPFREDPLEGQEEEEEEGEFRGTVQGWELGGKIYLQYLHTLSLFSSTTKTSQLSSSTSHQNYLISTLKSLQTFIIQINSNEKMKSNLKLKLATQEMSSRLNFLVKSGLGGSRALSITQPSLLDESDKLVWLQGATKNFLQSSLKKAGAVTTV